MTKAGPVVDNARLSIVHQTLTAAAQTQNDLASQASQMIQAAALCWEALEGGGKVLAFGNGGSAAEAQHFAAELTGRFTRERRALPAIALTTDSSALTAIGNDYGFARVFARQVEALGATGDVAVAISTSGLSPNVVEGLRTARSQGLRTIALTGGGATELAALSDVHIRVAAATPARIQEGQLTVLHVICDLVERDLVGE